MALEASALIPSFILSNLFVILYIPLLSTSCCADLHSFALCSTYFFQFGRQPLFDPIMITPLSALLFGVVALASPLVEVRTVTYVFLYQSFTNFERLLTRLFYRSLNQAAFEEAQQRDDTATRAFSSTAIKTSDGKCLFVDELSGDFRANLTPVQVAACDGSAGQQWDIITAGKHDDQAGTMLVVSSLVGEPLHDYVDLLISSRPKLASTSILVGLPEIQSFFSLAADGLMEVVQSQILNSIASMVVRDRCLSNP